MALTGSLNELGIKAQGILQVADKNLNQVNSINQSAKAQSEASAELTKETSMISRMANENVALMDEAQQAVNSLVELINQNNDVVNSLKQ